MGVLKEVSYRVVRADRVGIGSWDRQLVLGESADDFPEEVIEALLVGQYLEEVPVSEEPVPTPVPELEAEV